MKLFQLRPTALFAGSLLLMWATPAFSQYQVQQHATFDGGKIPDNAIKIGVEPDKTLTPVELSKVPGMPPAFRDPISAKETGDYGLKISAIHTNSPPNTGMILAHTVDRDKFNERGRALYQCDFWVPGPGEPLPSVAVLATESSNLEQGKTLKDVKTAFYRFGMTLGNKIYFSCVIPGQATASVYQQDEKLLASIPRPGWHRFAIVFEGSDTIRCYVDGREASFNPIKESTIRKLTVGVFVADKQRSHDVFVDNMSIQTSDDAPVLPNSPYTTGWTAAASTKVGVAPVAPKPVVAASGGPPVAWLEPSTAWQRAQAQKVPMLLYFTAPGIPATTRIERMMETEPAAREFLSKHSPAWIDLNQLQGGAIAKQYGVYKVPSFLVIAPDAKSYKRSTPSSSDNWAKIASDLTLQ